MHRSSFNLKPTSGVKGEEEILLSVTTLVTEGRVPEKLGPKSKGYREGPHCFLNNQTNEHICSPTDSLCVNYEYIREELLKIWTKDNSPTLCIEVLLLCPCQDGEYFVGSELMENCILLESWNFSICNKSPIAPPSFQVPQLVNAIRSQLYFSQITAWLTTQREHSKHRLTNKHLRYRIALPVDTLKTTAFTSKSVEHTFPSTDIGFNRVLNVSFLSLPRGSAFPVIKCMTCNSVEELVNIPFTKSCQVDTIQEDKLAGEKKKSMFDDRMHTMCKLKGKHHCEDFEELRNNEECEKLAKIKRLRQNLREEQPSTSTLNHINSTRQSRTNPSRIELIDSMMPNGSVHYEEKEDVNDSTDKTCHFYNDLIYKEEDKSKILLEAIERVGLRSPEKSRKKSSDSLQNDIHKIKDVEMEFQDYNDMNGTTIMNMHSKHNLSKLDQCCSNNILQTKISSNKNKKASLPLCDKYRSAVSSIQLEKKIGCVNEKCVCDNVHCDTSKSDICRYRNRCSTHIDKKYCDSQIPTIRYLKMKELSNNSDMKVDKKNFVTRKITFENFKNATEEAASNSDLFDKQNCPNGVIPTAVEQAEFRKNLDNAASMVFHSRTGLPLTSSPAPVRKGKTCFDFDSSINSVSDIKSALFPSNFCADDDSESDGSLVSPCSPDTNLNRCEKLERENEIKASVRCHRRSKGHASNLLGW
ncbi:hypothetical protein WA026_005012 [Henosepilachna vigintioctopunctata]|uniref:Uncharacterized protein n=1 Tax=Henosepilachna vigintioctopunctata TaxID=420089 RepID=A0AAW1ULX3_9CUCU